jgi:hypothetical protein
MLHQHTPAGRGCFKDNDKASPKMIWNHLNERSHLLSNKQHA